MGSKRKRRAVGNEGLGAADSHQAPAIQGPPVEGTPVPAPPLPLYR